MQLSDRALMAHDLLISVMLTQIGALVYLVCRSGLMVAHTSRVDPCSRKLIAALLSVGEAHWQSAALFSSRKRLLEELRESAYLCRCSTLQHCDYRGQCVV